MYTAHEIRIKKRKTIYATIEMFSKERLKSQQENFMNYFRSLNNPDWFCQIQERAEENNEKMHCVETAPEVETP